jgi:hypothetical protein
MKRKKMLAIVACLMMAAIPMSVSATEEVPVTEELQNMALEQELTEEQGSVAINETNFPDAVFREYLEVLVDKDKDGELSEEERKVMTLIDLDLKTLERFNIDGKVASLEGIEYFRNLRDLRFRNNNVSGSLDVSAISSLKMLYCSNNQITSLKLNPEIGALECQFNPLTELDLSTYADLNWLHCSTGYPVKLRISNDKKTIGHLQLYMAGRNRLD